MRTSGKQSALHFLTMQRVQDIFEVHSCSALHWRAKGSSCNVANGSIASTSYSRTILGSDRLGHFEGVFTGTNRRPSRLHIEVDRECDILSYWAGVVHEDQNECGYLTLGEKVLVLADMNGFGPNMTEDDFGIFVNDIVDPPAGRTKGWIPDGSRYCSADFEVNKSIPAVNLRSILPSFSWFVCLHWELAGKTYEQ